MLIVTPLKTRNILYIKIKQFIKVQVLALKSLLESTNGEHNSVILCQIFFYLLNYISRFINETLIALVLQLIEQLAYSNLFHADLELTAKGGQLSLKLNNVHFKSHWKWQLQNAGHFSVTQTQNSLHTNPF